jgi:predicted amidophosphoribosyltransferase
MSEDYFEFRQVDEEEEGLDFNRLTPCPHCKKPIPQNATMCLYCGKEVMDNKKSLWVVGTAIALIITFIILAFLGR